MTALRCPSCRRALAARVHCAKCATEFREVDGIVCFSDPDELEREQGEMLSEAWLAARGPTDTERNLAGIFARAHYSGTNDEAIASLSMWLDRHASADGAALEVGCGPGRFLFELASRFSGGAIGLDLRVGLLRIAARLLGRGEITFPCPVETGKLTPHRFQAPPLNGPIELYQARLDLAPFARGAFALVAAISLLDILPDPTAGLDQLDGLLAPGGLLLLACPYQWSPDVTPPERWLDGDTLRAALDRRGYRIVEQSDIAWVLPAHRRLAHEYLLDALLARKVAR